MEQLSKHFSGLKDIEVENSDDLDSATTPQQKMPEGDAQPRDDFEPTSHRDTVSDFTVSVSSTVDVIDPLVPSSISDNKVSCMRRR
jgi:hypothetical protein